MRRSTNTPIANINPSTNKPSIQERQDFIAYMMKAYLSDCQITVTVHNNLGSVDFSDTLVSIDNSRDMEKCALYFENGESVNINFSGCTGIKKPVGEYDGWNIGNQNGYFSFWMNSIEGAE